MLSFLKREKSKQLEDQLNAAQAQRRTGWENLPEDELFTPAGFSEEQAEATASSNYSYWGSTFRAFFKNKFAVALLIALVVVVAFAFIQPHLPGQADPNLCAVDPVTGIQYRNIAPGQDGFIWGSNSIGQDLWARIWAGARTSLTIAFFVALIEAVVGITAGVLWGYVRGLDFVFTELYNIFDNIPTAIVLILISYVATPSIWTMVLGMAIKGWIEMARFIRNQILIIRDRDYNVASRCIGTPTIRIVLRNLLPALHHHLAAIIDQVAQRRRLHRKPKADVGDEHLVADGFRDGKCHAQHDDRHEIRQQVAQHDAQSGRADAAGGNVIVPVADN